MDKKSKRSQLTIQEWLRNATAILRGVGIESARLDSEIILAHTLKRPRIYLHAHSDEVLDARHSEIADARIDLRRHFTPIAYIIGHKEFYGRRFKVTSSTLIPRPETETIIDMLKAHEGTTSPLIPQAKKVLDIGTGSGCLGITIKLEFPEYDVTLIDISTHALAVARQNATMLHADVSVIQGDLLRGYVFPADIIVANLPYVDREWEVSRETAAEPDVALYASNHGLSLINVLIAQASQLLTSGAVLYLEADPRQHNDIITKAKEQRFTHQQTDGFILSFTKL